MHWSFAKYVGCGNDFILFDNRSGDFPLSFSLVQSLCQRQRGIGADGLILLENSIKADFRMRIFNSDGSEAEMCGNGIRCFVKWLVSLGMRQPTYQIEVMHNVLNATLIDQEVCVEMGSPHNIQWNIPLRFEQQFLRVHYLNTGVPHAILFVEDVENVNIVKLGSYIRNYSLWMPTGTNVTVAQKLAPHKLKIRSYERGVEGETLACGTGATAAALAMAYLGHFSIPVIVETRSKEALKISYTFDNQKFSNVTMTGAAECIFVGEIFLIAPFYACMDNV